MQNESPDTGLPTETEQPLKKILVVDDEPQICSLCRDVLEYADVCTADNGQRALDVLETSETDLILTDVIMPKMGGLELLRAVKERHPGIPVIMMTGNNDREIIIQALKAGADDFINKPIDIFQLTAVVDNQFDKLAMHKKLQSPSQLEKLKDDFLGLISHKLKTPTTAISLFVQGLSDGISDRSGSAFDQTLEMVKSETEHLEKLIQDLLDVSGFTLQEDQLYLEPLELGELACQVASTIMVTAADQGVKLLIDIDLPLTDSLLQLDRQRTRFSIHALLDNAIKFSKSGGTVRLTGRQEEQLVKLYIQDNGCGIEREELPKIFQKFYQIDREGTGQVPGFGLGLFFAQNFIQKQNGVLQIDSLPNQGTTAIISFPLPR